MLKMVTDDDIERICSLVEMEQMGSVMKDLTSIVDRLKGLGVERSWIMANALCVRVSADFRARMGFSDE